MKDSRDNFIIFKIHERVGLEYKDMENHFCFQMFFVSKLILTCLMRL